MANSKIAIAKRIGYYIAFAPKPMTMGDIVDGLGLHSGTDAGRRLRESRERYGFTFEHKAVRAHDALSPYGKTRHVYVMSQAERSRVKALSEYKLWRRSVFPK